MRLGAVKEEFCKGEFCDRMIVANTNEITFLWCIIFVFKIEIESIFMQI